MSGPSLKKQDSHSSIHEAALNEAIELRDLVQICLQNGEKEKAVQVVEIVIEHWESRTLKHAEAEEEGLYKELVAEKPELEPLLIQFTRDHDLMRRMVEELNHLLMNNEVDERLVALQDSLLMIAFIHNEDEMNKLLHGNGKGGW